MSNLPFISAITVSAAVLVAGLVTGIKNWRSLGGKLVAIAAGLLLLALVAFVSLVLLIVISAQAGHPF
jgi:hypothetical protein